MAVSPSIDPAQLLEEQLDQASQDLLRELLQTFINTLMSKPPTSVAAAALRPAAPNGSGCSHDRPARASPRGRGEPHSSPALKPSSGGRDATETDAPSQCRRRWRECGLPTGW